MVLLTTGDEEVTSSTNQSNSTELDNPRTWVATSVLELGFTKQQHGRMLKCVALHESYSTKSQVIEVRLNVRCEYGLSSLLTWPFICSFTCLLVYLLTCCTRNGRRFETGIWKQKDKEMI
jgi:hypothetical protein